MNAEVVGYIYERACVNLIVTSNIQASDKRATEFRQTQQSGFR